MYPVESYDTPASEGIHEFATAHPAHHIDLCTMSSTAGYDMTHFYTGHQQGVFADLSPPITQNDGYVLPQFGAEYTFEYSSGFATGSPALNAENDSSFFNNASNQLLSPAPSSSPPFAAEHKKRKNSREHAPSDQHLHNDPLVQTSHRGNKRVKLSGSPRPALLPQRHKLKFTAEDDALLVDLKETHSYTWKQIAAYFPGRSSGTLQVRYCTRLKAQSEMWNDETVKKLKVAIQEYENNRWKTIASQVGLGKSAAACKAKAFELGVPITINAFKSDAALPHPRMLTPDGT